MELVKLRVGGLHHESVIDILSTIMPRKHGSYLGYLGTSDYVVWVYVPHNGTDNDSVQLQLKLLKAYSDAGANADNFDEMTGPPVGPDALFCWNEYLFSADEVRSALAAPAPDIKTITTLSKKTANNDADNKSALKFAGKLSRRIGHPATAKEIRAAWDADNLMNSWKKPELFDLDNIAAYIAKTFKRN